MNLKITKDGKYIIVGDHLEGLDLYPLIAISSISIPEDQTDSLYLFSMYGPQKKFYDISERNNVIIDGVDLI